MLPQEAPPPRPCSGWVSPLCWWEDGGAACMESHTLQGPYLCVQTHTCITVLLTAVSNSLFICIIPLSLPLFIRLSFPLTISPLALSPSISLTLSPFFSHYHPISVSALLSPCQYFSPSLPTLPLITHSLPTFSFTITPTLPIFLFLTTSPSLSLAPLHPSLSFSLSLSPHLSLTPRLQ